MGNQHEISQLAPIRVERGVVLRIRSGHWADVVASVDALTDSYYFIVERVDGVIRFPNLDADDAVVHIRGEVLAIQSGGKMWCGYAEWVDALRRLARHLEDGLFFVADEEDFVDRFEISHGVLTYQRVHTGSWYSLDQYFADHGLARAPE